MRSCRSCRFFFFLVWLPWFRTMLRGAHYAALHATFESSAKNQSFVGLLPLHTSSPQDPE